jgi:outer membrane protein TolC
MNRLIAALLGCVLLTSFPSFSASLPFNDWFYRRFHASELRVRPIEGIQERISDGKLHLTLKDFLELVLKNSTDINLIRLNVYTQADQITAAKAPLDPVLQFGFSTLRSVTPQFTEIGGAETLSSLTQNSFINYTQLLPTGQTVTASFNALRTTSNSEFNFYNPNINGILNIQILQPLLQDRTRIQFKGPLQIARTQLLITSEQSEGTIADDIAQAAVQYWEAVRARDFIKVEQQTVDLAKKSYDRDKLALDLGAIAKLAIYQSETQVAERNRDLIQAQYAYRTALDPLRRLMGADTTPELRSLEIVLDDDPATLPTETAILPYEDALAAALRARPEVSAARRRVGIDEINARIAHNSLLPRLDLLAQGSGTGLAGNQAASVSLIGTPIPATTSGFGTSLGQALLFSSPTYGAGLTFTFHVRDSASSAQLSDALVNRTRDLYTQRQIQQQITLDVRQAITSIELAKNSIEAARKARDLALKNVEAEQQRYELGGSTAFEVLDSQNRLANAENALLNAFVGYQEAYVSYERSTWSLLDGLGMVLETPKVK